MNYRIIFIIITFMFVVTSYASNTYEEIPTVIVEPIHYFNSLSRTTGNVKVLTEEQIRASNTSSLSQVLQAHMGLQVSDLFGDGSRTTVSMRGFGDNASSNMLILVNGQPLVNPDVGSPDLNIVPLSEVERIEVLPGSASVLYGDQAVGGVINIITKNPKKRERHAVIATGSYHSTLAQAVVSDLFNNGLGYRVNASFYDTHNDRDHNDYRVNRFNALLNYHREATDLDVRYQKINQHLQLPGALTREQADQNPHQAESDIPFNNRDIDFFQFGLKESINDDWKMNFHASFRKMEGRGALKIGENIPFPFTESRWVRTFHPKVDGIINLWHHKIATIVGGEIISGKYVFSGSDSKRDSYAIYGQVHMPFAKRFKVILGARKARVHYPLIQTKNDATATNVELSWQMRSHLRFFARRAESYRFPKVEEQTWTLTGKPLKTQTGVSYEGGVDWHIKPFHALLTVYQLNLKNEIICIPIATSDYFVYNENLEPTRRNGAIFNVGFRVKENWQIDADYNFVDAKFRSGSYFGKRLPFVAKHSFRLSSVYEFRRYFSLLIEGVFTGNRYPINDVENRDERLPGYTIYNAGLGYHKDHYAVDLRVNNLTDKRYHAYAVSTYQDHSVSTVFYPANGINFMLNLHYEC